MIVAILTHYVKRVILLLKRNLQTVINAILYKLNAIK